MPTFFDALNSESKKKFKRLAVQLGVDCEIQQSHSKPELEDIEEIDSLMKEIPGFNRDDNNI